jgi:dinuclear metal center YbgI/SA1388 family protein
MQIATIISALDAFAPAHYQESYDNVGLLVGSSGWSCTGVVVALDVTEEVVREAVSKRCNLIVAHHPIIFGGLKRINGNNPVGKILVSAIKQDIAIFAIHTNLDNILEGVNGKMASQLGLRNTQVLAPKAAALQKLFTFVPPDYAELVRKALFSAGAGHIGNYSETSFVTEGSGTFKPGKGTKPFLGTQGQLHTEKETKIEVIFPAHLQSQVVQALIAAHPYEEVAYDVLELANDQKKIGSGLIGELESPMDEKSFLERLKGAFQLNLIRHTRLRGMEVGKVALCGGAGSFLISNALAKGADFYISSDIKYHEFFQGAGQMVIADIGHFESEQYTIELLYDILREKFPTFAVLKSGIITNPVHYYS